MSGAGDRTRARLMGYHEWAFAQRAGKSACAIINADDWGQDAHTTARILDCVRAGSVTAVSGMVFMADSEHAADIARTGGLDVGLHLNLSTSLSAVGLPKHLHEHHEKVASYLRRSRVTRYLYHPGLSSSFRYLVASQFDEFSRLYGERPLRVDGHHHMHLCANVMLDRLLPQGLVIRRNFTFGGGEKNWMNRSGRRCYDALLSRRYRMVDAFVALAPVHQSARVARIFSMACRESVEIETHPIDASEHDFLVRDAVFQLAERRRDNWVGNPVTGLPTEYGGR